jgi:Type I restriction modification DNA specificity domain.
MAGVTNTGVVNYISNPVASFPQNSITVDIFGNVFYRDYDFGAGDDTGVYWSDEKKYSREAMLFFTISMQKSLSRKFSFGNKLRSSKSLDFTMKLPIRDGAIDFDFMENFIAKLEADRIAVLEAYLIATGLKDYTLNDDEQAALAGLNDVNWRMFKIEDVLVWQKGISELNPLHLDSLSISDEKKYPFYGQATVNNGIINYRHLNDDVLNNKLSKPTILIHSNNQNTVYLEAPFYLKDGHGATSVLQSEKLDNMNVHFIISSIQKVILEKFAYNNKATKIALKNTEISLPIKSDNTPDYDFMGCLISATQKLVIKDVCIYAENKAEVNNGIVEVTE